MQRAGRKQARPSQPGSILFSLTQTDRSTTSLLRATQSKTVPGSPLMWVCNKVVSTRLYTQPPPPIPHTHFHLFICINMHTVLIHSAHTDPNLLFPCVLFLLTALVMYLVIVFLPLVMSSPVFGNTICTICRTCPAILFGSCSNKITRHTRSTIVWCALSFFFMRCCKIFSWNVLLLAFTINRGWFYVKDNPSLHPYVFQTFAVFVWKVI